MKNSFIKILVVSVFLLLFVGCEDDFLEKEPSEFLTTEQLSDASAFNPAILVGSVSGTYSLTFDSGSGGTERHTDFGQKGYDIMIDMLCGDMALSQSVYGWYRASITEFQATQDFTSITNYQPWRYYYRIIRAAHIAIDGLGGEDIIPELEENKYIMGQAKALRAHSYFYLAQLFQKEYNPSELILPLYRSLQDQNGPKVSAQEIYDLIESDLTDAISLLENFTRANKSQINQDVARTIYAYVLASKGDYSNALIQAQSVISAGNFTMMQGAELTGGFNELSTPGWMWGVDLNADTGVGLLSFWGQVDYFSYSYAAVGDYKVMDADLFSKIANNDLRKDQFLDSPGSPFHGLPWFKFYDDARIPFGAGTPVMNDILFYRISEVYLLGAEMAAKSGDEGTARTLLSILMSTRVPDVSYINSLSGSSLLDEIYLQTRIELWGEGKSYLAMKRNQATIVRGDNHLSFVGDPIPYNDERLTFEIPQAEILNNPFISSQND